MTVKRISLLFLGCLLCSCGKLTTSPRSEVVELESRLAALIEGRTDVVQGGAKAGVLYLVCEPYSDERDFTGLDISDDVRRELVDIANTRKNDVVAMVVDGRLSQYTYLYTTVSHNLVKPVLVLRDTYTVRRRPTADTQNVVLETE